MIRKLLIATALVALGTSTSMAAINVTWWHAMGGANGQELDKIVGQFNASQTEYHVNAIYKGTYPETMTSAIAAFRSHKQPAIVQVFDVGTGTMLAAKGAVYPVYQLMKDENEPFDIKNYLSAVIGYYADSKGQMLSFPFNSSTPIVYYNKTAFEKAGLDPNTPPTTWAELVTDSKKLISSGAAKCGFTTQWVTWIQMENFSAIHNLEYGTEDDGYGGLDAKFTFNNKAEVRHWANLKKWQDEGIFRYGGPVGGDASGPLFYAGTCAMLMGSSAARAAVLDNSKGFEIGYGYLPYYADVIKKPLNSITGGASLWVLKGQKPEVYKGVAKFFTFLSQPKIQAEWSEFTGYVPITTAAYNLEQSQGYFKKNPGAEIALKQLTRATPTVYSKGVRFGNLAQVRDIQDSNFEALLAGKKTAKDALDDAVTRGNKILRNFQAANQ